MVAHLRRWRHAEELLEVESRRLLCIEVLVLRCLGGGSLYLLLLLLLSCGLVWEGCLAGVSSVCVKLRRLVLLVLLLIPEGVLSLLN